MFSQPIRLMPLPFLTTQALSGWSFLRASNESCAERLCHTPTAALRTRIARMLAGSTNAFQGKGEEEGWERMEEGREKGGGGVRKWIFIRKGPDNCLQGTRWLHKCLPMGGGEGGEGGEEGLQSWFTNIRSCLPCNSWPLINMLFVLIAANNTQWYRTTGTCHWNQLESPF